MEGLQLTWGLLVLLCTTSTQISGTSEPDDPVPTVSEECALLMAAGMQGYDMLAGVVGQDGLESANEDIPFDLDLTDRSAVRTFLCLIAEKNSFAELSEFLDIPESQLRRFYNQLWGMASMALGVNDAAGIQHLLNVYSIFKDVVAFADDIGFHPDPFRRPGQSSEESSEEENEVVVDEDQAMSFIESMTERYGEDFATDLARVTAMSRGPSTQNIQVDRMDLLIAIVESKTTAEFAEFIGLTERHVETIFHIIGTMPEEMFPSSGILMADYLNVVSNIVDAALQLGFLALE